MYDNSMFEHQDTLHGKGQFWGEFSMFWA